MRPDPLSTYRQAPLAELLAVLLRQFRRPLAAHGVTFTDAEAAEIARRLAENTPLDARETALRDALAVLVRESEGVLARWSLTFAQSLAADMDAIPGWETTAEFLEIANEKTNAELRIATGSALLVALGDTIFIPHLETLVRRGEPDLDTVIAERVLALIQS
ncbi:MAG: hypothetical protein SF162_10340 [bacterium]|nr:hypothetical protein [bacterium]